MVRVEIEVTPWTEVTWEDRVFSPGCPYRSSSLRFSGVSLWVGGATPTDADVVAAAELLRAALGQMADGARARIRAAADDAPAGAGDEVEAFRG